MVATNVITWKHFCITGILRGDKTCVLWLRKIFLKYCRVLLVTYLYMYMGVEYQLVEYDIIEYYTLYSVTYGTLSYLHICIKFTLQNDRYFRSTLCPAKYSYKIKMWWGAYWLPLVEAGKYRLGCQGLFSKVLLKLSVCYEWRTNHITLIFYITFELLYVMLTFPTRIFYRGVSVFANDCPCGVWCRLPPLCRSTSWKSSLKW